MRAPQVIRFAKVHKLALLSVFASSFLIHLAVQFAPIPIEAYRLAVKAASPWWGLFVTSWNASLSEVPAPHVVVLTLAKFVPAAGFAFNVVALVFVVWFVLSMQRGTSDA